MTREYADPNGALDRFLCDTAEAHVADVRLCGIRGGGSSSFPMGQTAHPAVAAGMVEPGGATSGTLQAIAPAISFATFCHSAAFQPSAAAPTLVS